MRYLCLLFVVACGAPAVTPSCPSSPAEEVPCCESEVAEQRCVDGQAWVCEPSAPPCYESERVNGLCPAGPDGGELHPELVNRRLWWMNGTCP
jgi:hypothetical protein